jgi:hypothetical protein
MLLHRKLTLSLALLGLALSAPRAEAVTIQVIDSFNGPEIDAPDGPTTVFLPADQAVTEGVRTTTVTDGTMTSSNGNLVIDGTGAVGEITWTPDAPLNLAASNDRFALDIIGTPVGSWTAEIFATDGTYSDSVEVANLASGTAYFLFSDFVDVSTNHVLFANIQEITLTLTDLTTSSITLGELRAVPEPSTAGMLMLGLFGLARMGRSRKLAA